MNNEKSNKELKCSMEGCNRKADFDREDTGEKWCEEHFWEIHSKINDSDGEQRDGYV